MKAKTKNAMRPGVFACTYDSVWSLGQWCATAMAMKKLGLRSASGPFDWMMGREMPVRAYVDLLTTEFAGFFLRENMQKVCDSPMEGTEYWKDTKQGLEIRHDFMLGVPFEANYVNFHIRMGRRIGRLLKLLRSGGRMLFVHWRGEGLYRREEIVADVRRLRTAFPESAIDLLVVETENSKAVVSYEEPEPGVVFAVGDFYDQKRFDPVQGNVKLVREVFRRIHMRGRLKNVFYLRLASLRKRLARFFRRWK